MTKGCFSVQMGKETLTIETGKMAKQAHGAVTVRLGGTVVLSTCVCAKDAREGVDFLPLTVEYREKTYAAGKIPGGFFKREGRPSEKEILTARLVDRPIRPLFPKDMVTDIQIVNLVLSSDGENDSDILAVNGTSAALGISDIPFDGPIGCVRVGLIDDKFVLNPTFQELEKSKLDLVVVGKEDRIIMIEAGCNELGEDKIEDALTFAKKYIDDIVKLQKEMIAKCGREKRKDIILRSPNKDLLEKVRDLSFTKFTDINQINDKSKRDKASDELTGQILKDLMTDDGSPEEWEIKAAIQKIEKEAVRSNILENKKRTDNRSFKEIRTIECGTDVLPRTHGSGLFTRGQTQALCVTTLGTSADEQMIDALEGETQKSFMLHYNFPPFSVGETSPFRGPGRREIGHGALAEKALKPVMPPKEQFPYTVRIVSDILESNGSTSMASVCAGSLSLMDAGVPTKSHVAGIAIGLVTKGDKYVLLTDIAGSEDHYGDMDFKVAGTKDGITAIQLDLKIKGLEIKVLREALTLAKEARLEILGKMNNAISKPKENVSSYAPKIINLKVNPDKIKEIIGPGGRTIKKIIKDTGVTIDIEDDGTVQIASSDEKAIEKALATVKGLSSDAEVGKIYNGNITRIMNFGAFCEILPGKEGLIHISEIADRFVKDVSQELKVGQEVVVKVVEIDQQGRINLSIKQAMKKDGENEVGGNKNKEEK
ncbi:MAG: polyribonucleotide nucleotidyltransferase [Candidatus Omnitrophica bacterium]|nr:polyribonucleotide nucleotidyltransferase [Candidatus Omnitrophota bacterium]